MGKIDECNNDDTCLNSETDDSDLEMCPCCRDKCPCCSLELTEGSCHECGESYY